jgi:hypothetical protein
LNIKGNGEAYQSWNKDQVIAIEATILRWSPVKFLVGNKSSLILLLTFSLMIWFIIKRYLIVKKRPDKNQAFLI